MKTIRIKVYQFNELSEKAKQVAINHYRNNDNDLHWSQENRLSMEKFAEIWPIKVTNWSYGRRGEGVFFHFTESDKIENLKDQRLATYIWNNYRSLIYSKTYKKSWITEKKIIHTKVKSQLISIDNGWSKNAKNLGKYYNQYYTGKIETDNCPLTGYCIDNNLLDQVWKFLDKPDNRNFKELLESCFNNWIEACNADIDYQNSDEFISEEIINNDINFTIDGLVFNY